MNKKMIGIAVLLVLLAVFFLIIGLAPSKNNTGKKKPRGNQSKKVEAFIVSPSLLVNRITVNGSLMAFESVELKNEVAGRIVKLNLPEGKLVRKGTLLVKLFDDDLQAELKRLEAELAVQEQIYNRQAALVKVNGIAQNDYEQNGLKINTLKAQIDIEKASIRKTEILAPFEGMVGLRNVSEGAVVNTSTVLATFRKIDKLKLDFFVPEKYSSFIVPGMAVQFSLSGDDQPYKATVIASESGIDKTTRNLKVRALVNESSPALLDGGYANVELNLSENPNALLIPTQAIIPDEADKLVIVARNGKAHFVSIKTGVRKTAAIEVVEGLQAGDTIITTGMLFVKEGAPLMYSSIKDGI